MMDIEELKNKIAIKECKINESRRINSIINKAISLYICPDCGEDLSKSYFTDHFCKKCNKYYKYKMIEEAYRG